MVLISFLYGDGYYDCCSNYCDYAFEGFAVEMLSLPTPCSRPIKHMQMRERKAALFSAFFCERGPWLL